MMEARFNKYAMSNGNTHVPCIEIAIVKGGTSCVS